jgi:hypothetical protein
MEQVEASAWRQHPLVQDVIHDKMDIRRHHMRLNGRDIDTPNLGARVFVAHWMSESVTEGALSTSGQPLALNGPFAKAGAQIGDPLGVVANGRQVKALVGDVLEEDVADQLALMLTVVVGEGVHASSEGMIPPGNGSVWAVGWLDGWRSE